MTRRLSREDVPYDEKGGCHCPVNAQVHFWNNWFTSTPPCPSIKLVYPFRKKNTSISQHWPNKLKSNILSYMYSHMFTYPCICMYQWVFIYIMSKQIYGVMNKKNDQRFIYERYWSKEAIVERLFHRLKIRGFNLSTIDILSQIILCYGNCPVRCKMWSSIPALDPRDASSNTPLTHTHSCDNQKNVTDTLKCLQGDKLSSIGNL